MNVPVKFEQSFSDVISKVKSNISSLLAKVQDLNEEGIDLDQITFSLAQVTKLLFEAQKKTAINNYLLTLLKQTMNNLRTTLGLIQDLKSNKDVTVEVMKSLASTMGILYPLTKSIERMLETGQIELNNQQKIEQTAKTDNKVIQESPQIQPQKIPEPKESFAKSKDEPLLLKTKKSKQELVEDSNRRIKPRIDLEVDIGINSDNNFFTGFSENISEGGIFVSTYLPLPIGTKVNINFTLPDGYIVKTEGIVKWIRENDPTNPDTHPGMGIKFENLSQQDNNAINKFIDQKTPIFYDDL